MQYNAIFTDPNDYVLAMAARFPTLYSGANVEEVKVKVLDQLLNVIGNGIRDHDELMTSLERIEFDRDRAIKVCNGEPVWYGYFKTRKFFRDEAFPDGDPVRVLESEKVQYLDVVLWQESRCFPWNPYPNFEKKYSTVWQTQFKELGTDWCEAAIWFYTQAREWLKENESHYHYAYPCANAGKTDKFLNDMIERRNKYESDEAFSQAYEHPYNGDMHQFLVSKWQKERDRIMEFIDETIAHLSS